MSGWSPPKSPGSSARRAKALPDSNELETAERTLARVGGFDTRWQIFLCADPEEPKCCDRAKGHEAWLFLKKRLGELGLGGHTGVLRNKVGCLRVCAAGPVAVVWPGRARKEMPRSTGSAAPG